MLPALWNESMLAPAIGGPDGRLSSLFDHVFGGGWDGVPMAMWEDEDHLYIEADLPGIKDNKLDITIQGDRLSIRGERRREEGRNYLYDGRGHGRFERVMNLPEAVVADGVRAEMRDGVLSLVLPKRPEAKPYKIALQQS